MGLAALVLFLFFNEMLYICNCILLLKMVAALCLENVVPELFVCKTEAIKFLKLLDFPHTLIFLFFKKLKKALSAFVQINSLLMLWSLLVFP